MNRYPLAVGFLLFGLMVVISAFCFVGAWTVASCGLGLA